MLSASIVVCTIVGVVVAASLAIRDAIRRHLAKNKGRQAYQQLLERRNLLRYNGKRASGQQQRITKGSL